MFDMCAIPDRRPRWRRLHPAAGVRVDEEIGKAGDVDTAVVMLRFRNGVIGTIDNCRKSAYGYDQRAEVLEAAAGDRYREHLS